MINIFYAANESYAIPTCVSIASLLKNHTGSDGIRIFIYDFGLSDKSKAAIEHLKQQINDFDLEFRSFDISTLNVFDVGKWNPIIRLKLFADKLFPDLDRVMWMNGNNIIRGEIEEIYNLETDKYLTAATCNILGRISICDCLVVYNILKMRQDGLFDKIIDIVKRSEKAQKAYAGEYALGQIDNIEKLSEKYFACVDISDYRHEYVSPNSTVLKFSERNGFCPWRISRDEYPDIAKASYDEWHEYCDLTDYKGLSGRLNNISWVGKIKHRYVRIKRCYLVNRRIKRKAKRS